MHKKEFLSFLILMMVVSLMTSCSNTRFLAEGESLYVGGKVEVLDTMKRKERKKVEDELEDVLRPKPNRTFLGMKARLWVYNVVGEPKKEKGLKFWLRDKFGEEPVMGADFNVNYNNDIVEHYLANQGYLHADSRGKLETKKKKSRAHFTVKLEEQTFINNVDYEIVDSLMITRHIADVHKNSLLKVGDPYNLNVIKNERERISEYLKTIGYYFFSPDHILVRADTSVGPHLLNLTVALKLGEMPDEAKYQYKINEVIIQPNYQLRNTRTNRPQRFADTVSYEHFKVVDRSNTFKPSVFTQAMQFKKGRYYNRRDQHISLNRLISLGTFRFVKNEFAIVDSTKRLLDVSYLLTPAPRKGFNIEVEAFGNNENRLGSRASILWTNKNLFRGAELFTIKLTGGIEKQFGGELKSPDQYSFGVESSLSFPRFLLPFPVVTSSVFIPKTLIHLDYNFHNRRAYSRTNVYTASFGYNWKEDISKEHTFYPFNISLVYTDTIQQSDDYFMKMGHLYYNGIIIGPTYEYTFNSQLHSIKKDNFYFNGAADFSGNIIGLAQKAHYDKNPGRILNMDYAQYVKLQADFRYYRHFTEESILAFRVFGGWGASYGNSYRLPSLKQFYSGGSNSLRGFQSRLIGPGSYHPYMVGTGEQLFIEMLGDIKLEANLEWRMKLYRFLKGAVFVDAGNIWLQRPNSEFPGGEFSKDFYKEIAFNAGAGLRFDFSILILRLDFGFPIRQPWLPEDDRWIYKYIDFRDAEWRKQNLMLNIAIGYPF